jgi:hypothetical protein
LAAVVAEENWRNKRLTLDSLLNDFAIRCFRVQGDQDYISARMACRAQLVTPFLWSSQQAIEKYLKCILLLNRIPGKHVKHNLDAALRAIDSSRKLVLELSLGTKQYIEYLETFGRYRYLENSPVAVGANLVDLDRAAWELRRYCTLSEEPIFWK